MGSITDRWAAALVARALEAGHTLTVTCPNGETLTAGRKSAAVGPVWYHALRWGRSRWADPSGREVAEDPIPSFVAWSVVEHCGRGKAAQAARRLLDTAKQAE